MPKQYPSEVRERAVRLVLETRDQYKTQSPRRTGPSGVGACEIDPDD